MCNSDVCARNGCGGCCPCCCLARAIRNLFATCGNCCTQTSCTCHAEYGSRSGNACRCGGERTQSFCTCLGSGGGKNMQCGGYGSCSALWACSDAYYARQYALC